MSSGLATPAGVDPAGRPTIREVADAAGVSRSTVSRALSGRGYVAPPVRDRVRQVARKLGYVPDATARHLRQQASRSIGVLVSDLNNPFYAGLAAGISQQARNRQYTMRAAFAAAGIPADDSLVVRVGWDVEAARKEAHVLLGRAEPPTAIFAANNVLAEAVWRAAAERGLSIPDQLSLVAFDDVPWMRLVRPGATAVAQDPAALGEAAVTQLFDRIRSPLAPARTVLLSATVTSRGSTAPPPGHPH
ncbi:LacI family DNA-binding transcriptional regulator [Micromonospora pallida]|uniref:LacI family DNA-binding transcriptional regulator n=1 Tax=Micromonospora pallida TaxID=145854 RepID=UPI001C401CFE|nr:LacI family DNA-binding transcriptional regulator [Micromonospora pallida]